MRCSPAHRLSAYMQIKASYQFITVRQSIAKSCVGCAMMPIVATCPRLSLHPETARKQRLPWQDFLLYAYSCLLQTFQTPSVPTCGCVASRKTAAPMKRWPTSRCRSGHPMLDDFVV